ncbi:MAG: hypothetical protein ACYDDO_14580 [Acidiferrobacterales bacterium]
MDCPLFRRCNVSVWVLMFGLGMVSIPIAQGDDTGCPPVTSGPPRPCPYAVPLHPVQPPTPAERQKIMQDLERAEREYQAQPKAPPPAGILPGSIVGDAMGAGGSAYLIENGWFGTVNGKDVRVYAGAMRYDPTTGGAVEYDPVTVHGFVTIIVGTVGKPGARSNQIYTPTAVGSLHIVAAQGTVLTLQSRQGNMFSLDVATEQMMPLASPK